MRIRDIIGLLAAIGASAGAAGAERLPIQIDGLFEDWTSAPVYQDAVGDGGTTLIDLGRIWAADDAGSFYLRAEIGTEIQLNADHDVVLYLDTDMDDRTGLAIGGIGAELEWRFGARAGSFHYGGGSTAIQHAQIRFIGLPSVTSSIFEMSLGRNARPDGSHLLFTGPSIRILLWDRAGGDRAPEDGESLIYTFDQGTLPPEEMIPLRKERAGDLRITTNNTLSDGLWNGTRGSKFRREFAALAPEILNFQEVYDHTAQETAALVETWLPSGPGEIWYAADNADCQTVSRYPIEDSWGLDGNLATLVNTIPAIGAKLLLVSAHLPCCENDAQRQQEIDRIMSFVRDARGPGGEVDVPENTVILVTGDMNFVGDARQLRTLVTGDIVDNATFGPDFRPDWDGSDLLDLIARHNAKRLATTWSSDSSPFWPGRLDFLVLSDSAVEIGNRLILNTGTTPPDTLAAHGLQSGDSGASDHLPLCIDLRSADPSESTDAGGGSGGLRLRVGPNPAASGATLAADLPAAGDLQVEVCDAAGRRLALPLGAAWVHHGAGPWSFAWNGDDDDGRRLPPGTYFVRLRVRGAGGELMDVRKCSILR
jgi:endonuclease/exonuclease/phosphatase family metal-dependent hydrolase